MFLIYASQPEHFFLNVSVEKKSKWITRQMFAVLACWLVSACNVAICKDKIRYNTDASTFSGGLLLVFLSFSEE